MELGLLAWAECLTHKQSWEQTAHELIAFAQKHELDEEQRDGLVDAIVAAQHAWIEADPTDQSAMDDRWYTIAHRPLIESWIRATLG